MKAFKRVMIGLLVAILFLTGLPAEIGLAAIPEYELDEDEFNLWIEEYPWNSIYDLDLIYAKFATERKDTEDYDLCLWDNEDALKLMRAAMTAAGVKPDNYDVFAMGVELYSYDDEGDRSAVTSVIPVTLICPIADALYDRAEKAKVVGLDKNGKFKYIDFELVMQEGVICAIFTIESYAPYGFIVEKSGSGAATTPKPTATSTPKPTATPTPKPTAAPTAKPTATPTPRPTAVPTAKPTTAPTAKPTAKPTQAVIPTAAASGTTPTPKPTSKPSKATVVTQATPTPIRAANSNSQRDDTPTTGDDFSLASRLLVGSISFGVLLFAVVKLKKGKAMRV